MVTLEGQRARAAGLVAGVLLAGAVVAILLPLRSHISSATPALALILPGVLAAVIGGRVTAAVVAVGTSLTLSVLFLPPYGEWKILQPEDITAAIVFVIVAVGVGELTAREADRRRFAEAR